MSGYDALMGHGPASAEEGTEQPQAAPEVQPQETPATEAPGEQVSATPQAPENPVTPAPVAQEAAPPAAPREWTVPGQAFLSEREKRQAAERAAREAQQRLDEIARQEAESKQQRPDPLVEPEAFQAFLDRQLEERLGGLQSTYEARIEKINATNSERYWSERLDVEEWNGLNDWLRSLPPKALAELKRFDDPYGVALPKYRQVMTFETLGGMTPQAWLESRIEEEAVKRGFVRQPPAATPQSAAPAAPAAPAAQPAPPQAQTRRSAPSLADVVTPTTANQAPPSGYDALFKR